MKTESKFDMLEYRWAIWVSAGIMLFASIPYIFGYAIAPPGYKFIGLTHNVDDACVYLSWMRQAADGRFFLQNLFTAEEQLGRGFHLLFLALGKFAGITNLPLIFVFHAARIISGMALLLLIYKFSSIWLKDITHRRIGMLVVGLSAGFGWLFVGAEGIARPVDIWQPEAITFLSLYLSPLFTVSLLLMVGSLYALYQFSQFGGWKWPLFAGASLLILANIHTYDIITIAIVWALYAAYMLLKTNFRPIAGGLIAAVIAAPSAAYQWHIYLNEPVFQARAAVETLSPNIIWYILGFGLLIPLAVLGISAARKKNLDIALPICWIIASFLAAYLPVAFQRKMIMGIHIPISLLATIGIFYAIAYIPEKFRKIGARLLIGMLILTNIAFMGRDMSRIMENEAHTTAHTPFISNDSIDALNFIAANTDEDAIILAPSGLASLIPGLSGRMVYCGHWGETADFAQKIRRVARFYTTHTENEWRRNFLTEERITHVVAYRWLDEDFVDLYAVSKEFLVLVHATEEVIVYQVLK